MANEKRSFPTERMVRFEFFESTSSDIFSFDLAAKSVARFLSATGSADLIRSAASGPRISSNAATSNASAERIRVSAASFGELNSVCFFESVFAAVSDFSSEAARRETPRNNAKATIVEASREIFEELVKLDRMFIAFSPSGPSVICDRHHRCDHHRHHGSLRLRRAHH